MKQRVMTAAYHSLERTDCESGARETCEDVSEGLRSHNCYGDPPGVMDAAVTMPRFVQVPKRYLPEPEMFFWGTEVADS